MDFSDDEFSLTDLRYHLRQEPKDDSESYAIIETTEKLQYSLYISLKL